MTYQHTDSRFRTGRRRCNSVNARWTDALIGRVLRMACGLLLALPVAATAADEIAAQQTGGLLLHRQNGYEVATRINTDIRMQISGLVARVEVSQAFRNDGDQWVEGVYVFPLPAGAAVDRMRLRVGERVLVGEIQPREKAAQIYAVARRDGKKASLVGQQRSNLFTTSVANIAPGETVRIEIAYQDTVAYDDGAFSLRFPLTMTPRYIPGEPLPDRQGSGWSADTTEVPDASTITPPVVATSSDHHVTFNAVIDAGMPLDVVASRYQRIDVSQDAGRYQVRFSTDEISNHDVELLWRPGKAAAPRALAFTEVDDGQPYLLVMLMPPDGSAPLPEPPPRELVLVVDTSGSMHGVSLGQAKRAALFALDGLRPQDRFNLIQFNTITQALFPSSVAATADNLRTAARYVESLSANGGTEMRPALLAALRGTPEEGRLRQVVFVTDGAVGNEDALLSLIDERLADTRLFTVGIGSAPNGAFMRKAAEAGRGVSVTVNALHEVQEKMSRLLRRLEQSQVTDLVASWPDGLEPVVYPERIPDLYAGEPVILKARLERAPRDGDQLRLSGHSAGGAWSADLPLRPPPNEDRHNRQDDNGDAHNSKSGVAALWARARIEDLLDRERHGVDVHDAIVSTAMAHHLVSRYTSLVAVDRTPSRAAGAALDREQVPALLPYGQDLQAIFGFPSTATLAPLHQLIGVLCTLVATLLLLYRVWTVEPDRELAPPADAR